MECRAKRGRPESAPAFMRLPPQLGQKARPLQLQATTYRSWQVLHKSCAKPRAKTPQSRKSCNSSVTKLGSVRPSDAKQACPKTRRDSTATFEHPLGATTSAAGRNRAAIGPSSRRRQPLAARNPADRRSVLFSKAVTFPWTPHFHDAYALLVYQAVRRHSSR